MNKISDELLKQRRASALLRAKRRKFNQRQQARLTSVKAPGSGLGIILQRAIGQNSPTNATPVNFSATFSAPVSNFISADVTFTGTTTGGTPAALVTGSGVSYNIAVTGITGQGTLTVRIPAGVASDAAGTLNTEAVATCLFDAVAPTVTINKAAGQGDPTSLSPITYTVIFSEAVIGFLASDISFTGSTAGGTLLASLSGSGPTYSIEVTGMTTDGDVVASIPAGSAVDTAGNLSSASTSSDNIVAWVAAVGGAGLKAPLGMGLLLN